MVCAGVGSGFNFRKVPAGSGVCWWGRFRRQVPDGSARFRRVLVKVPEAGSGRFRRVPVCAGVGSGGRFRKVQEGSGVCWCRFRRFFWRVAEGCGVCWCGFRMQFRKVPAGSGVCWWCRFRRQVPDGSGGCRFRRQIPEGSGGFRRVLVQVPETRSGRFRRVPVCVGVGSGKVQEGSGGFRSVLV